MWRDICVGNREAMLSELSTYQAMLAHLKTLIESSNGEGLERIFQRASQARQQWGAQRVPAVNAEP